MYDVVVIGGGPAGSQVAYKLAGMGHSVVVVERKQGLEEAVCCTGIIGQECVNSFDIDESVIHRRAYSARVFSPSGRLLHLRRPEPQACIVDRAALNVALATRAQNRGAEYVMSCPVTGIEVADDRVSVAAGGRGGGSGLIEARAAVLASGFGSKLAEGLGLGKVGDFAMGAQTEVETREVAEVEVYCGQEVAPGFFAWLVPTSPKRALVGLLSRRSPGQYLERLLSSLRAQGRIALAETEPSYGGIPLRPLARTYGDRIVVVGTAAGQVKPTTGGGIYYGLLCADIAASNLHQALATDTLSARNLASYQRQWRRKLGPELRVGYWARKFYELLNDAQIDKIFDIMRSNGIAEALLEADDLSFDWHSQAVLRLMGHKAMARALRVMKLPFLSLRRGPKEPGSALRGHPRGE